MEQLEAYGYQLEDIRLKEDDKLLYVKLSNRTGKYLYLDLEGKDISFSEGEVILQKSSEVIAPNSLLRGSLSCVEPEVSAVAVECERGVCILSRGQRFNLQEDSFVLSEKKSCTLKESSCHPVVKYSELCLNPTQMERSLRICSERICKSELKACCTLMEEIPCALTCLNKNWSQFYSSLCARKQELIDSINELEKYKCSYERNCNTSCDKYQLILYNIKLRQEKLDDIIGMCKSLYCLKDTLLGLSEEIETNSCWIDRETCDLKYVFPLP